MFDYDPVNGLLIWKHRDRDQFDTDRGYRVFTSVFKGKVAGSKVMGCRRRAGVMVRGFGILPVHRVIWVMHYGDIPDGLVIDHANGDPSDNRIENLRACRPADNNRNSKGKRKSASKLKGVSMYNQRGKIRWRSRICTDNGRICLGLFDTEQDAFKAYEQAARKYHGEYARVH